jgi:cathepsin X
MLAQIANLGLVYIRKLCVAIIDLKLSFCVSVHVCWLVVSCVGWGYPQYILNCGDAGSCHGGSTSGVYSFIADSGYVPYDTCQPYLACSSDSTEGFCGSIDTTCSAENTCRTCFAVPIDNAATNDGSDTAPDAVAASSKPALNFSTSGTSADTHKAHSRSAGFTGECAAVNAFPNASVAEHGSVVGEEDMMAEIYARGPISCGVDANPLHDYQGML